MAGEGAEMITSARSAKMISGHESITKIRKLNYEISVHCKKYIFKVLSNLLDCLFV